MATPASPATFDALADLPLEIESVSLRKLELRVSPRFLRRTTIVRLRGGGHQGLGEDVTYEADEQKAFRRVGGNLPLAGRSTLRELSGRLDELELWPEPPRQAASRDYRRWAFESAALDLALRQAGRSLADALGRTPAPLRFVCSTAFDAPDLARLLRFRELHPELRFKLDATPSWTEAMIAELAALDVVDVVDLKGAYVGTPVDQGPDAELYRRVAEGLPAVWIEDPALDEATRAVLAPHMDRVTWDAPIHSAADIEALEHPPRMLNFKPSRFGTVERLLAAYDLCRERGIAIYGGGQFELGVGRGQIQLLASLFHPDAPNDVAPSGYHTFETAAHEPGSPLAPQPAETGFRRE